MNINLKEKATKLSSFLVSLGILSGLITTAEGKLDKNSDNEFTLIITEEYPDLDNDSILIKEELLDKEENAKLDLSISNEEKIAWILKKWDLTKEELKIIMATIVHEGGFSYVEGYAVINSVYNRTISKAYASKENQRNLYYQITRQGQYNSYLKGSYKKYLNLSVEECPAMQAIIDFLYQEKVKIIHHYLGFRANGNIKFTSNGNGYRSEMSEDDYLTDNFIVITVEEINAIAEVGGFANYYKEDIKEEKEEINSNEDTTIVLAFDNKPNCLRLIRTK